MSRKWLSMCMAFRGNFLLYFYTCAYHEGLTRYRSTDRISDLLI